MLESLFATLLPAAGHAYESNAVPRRTGNRHVADSYVPFDTFEASDGWVAIVCATDEHWLNLTLAMQRPDLQTNEALRGLKGRIEQIDAVTDMIAEWAAQRTRDDVTALCQRHHVPCAPLRDVLEVLEDPHLHARGFLTHQSTAAGPVALPNSPMRYAGSALRPLTPPPSLGQHTDEVLTELCGLDAAALAELHRTGVI
jgi:crotonobetainyl-CoA:carnitine CoA-transferase CaiB-like acyl-CoA transferase